MHQKLHLIAFDVPWPPDYGGVVDIFFKMKALHAAGSRIILHCFDYGRGQTRELDLYCEKVYYYPRKINTKSIFTWLPYIVSSRHNNKLLDRLAGDPYPILFEGLHTCLFLNHPLIAHKRKIVRMHNVENRYYERLAWQEHHLAKKVYYKFEAIKLKRFEKILSSADAILAIKPEDVLYFSKYSTFASYLPPFHANEKVEIRLGTGDFLLYHGNLSVNENKEAVTALLDQVAPTLNKTFLIAGKNPSPELVERIKQYPHVELVANPNRKHLEELIENAHIHLLPTFQNTGVKLKLLHALFRGRYCLVNSTMIDGLDVNDTCVVENNLDRWPVLIQQLLMRDFDELERKKRERLFPHFDNLLNVAPLLHLLFEDKKE